MEKERKAKGRGRRKHDESDKPIEILARFSRTSLISLVDKSGKECSSSLSACFPPCPIAL